MSTPLISVIMPVYNVRDYLAWSIKSVLDQSYPHFQLICVDDGSTDESGSIADAIARSDSRIIVIHQQNHGPSDARNTGILHATGDIIAFLDSDDALRPDALQTIATTYEATGFDLLTYGATPYPIFEASVWLNTALSPRNVEYEGFHPDILFREKSHPFTWRTACRRRFLENSGILFSEHMFFGEDQVFHFRAYPLSEKTVFIADKLVDYRIKREDSLMSTRFRDIQKRAYEHIEVLDQIMSIWQQNGCLNKWPNELFEWSVDFILPSLMLNQDCAEYDEIVDRLASVWRSYFNDAFLNSHRTGNAAGPIISAVLNDKHTIQKRRALWALFNMRRHTWGLPYALRQAAERPLRRLKSKTLEARHAIWQEEDAAELQAAKERFGLT